jgi:hypothetical protein
MGEGGSFWRGGSTAWTNLAGNSEDTDGGKPADYGRLQRQPARRHNDTAHAMTTRPTMRVVPLATRGDGWRDCSPCNGDTRDNEEARRARPMKGKATDFPATAGLDCETGWDETSMVGRASPVAKVTNAWSLPRGRRFANARMYTDVSDSMHQFACGRLGRRVSVRGGSRGRPASSH